MWYYIYGDGDVKTVDYVEFVQAAQVTVDGFTKLHIMRDLDSNIPYIWTSGDKGIENICIRGNIFSGSVTDIEVSQQGGGKVYGR